MKSNGFSRSGMNNSTSYQSNFNDAAQSTSTSKHFNQSLMAGVEHKKPNQRSESLVARSMTYSHCTWPHWDRKFSSAAAERHIPIWQSIIHKPSTLLNSNRKRPSVQLPHLSQTSYNKGGFESSLMNNTTSTFRSSAAKFPKDPMTRTQQNGLPPTYKSGSTSKNIDKTRKDFATKRCFCSSCGGKYNNFDRFWATWGDKRVIQ
jgi:hypothetical protein